MIVSPLKRPRLRITAWTATEAAGSRDPVTCREPIRSSARWRTTEARPIPTLCSPAAPAIDTGSSASCPAIDQRGVTPASRSGLRHRCVRGCRRGPALHRCRLRRGRPLAGGTAMPRIPSTATMGTLLNGAGFGPRPVGPGLHRRWRQRLCERSRFGIALPSRPPIPWPPGSIRSTRSTATSRGPCQSPRASAKPAMCWACSTAGPISA